MDRLRRLAIFFGYKIRRQPINLWNTLRRCHINSRLQPQGEDEGMKHVLIGVAAVVLALSASLAAAQGVQTGTLTGTIQSADGLPLPGVTVTASSAALQGQRVAVTDVNGVYFLKGLPSGTYSVTFELSSFKTAKAD